MRKITIILIIFFNYNFYYQSKLFSNTSNSLVEPDRISEIQKELLIFKNDNGKKIWLKEFDRINTIIHYNKNNNYNDTNSYLIYIALNYAKNRSFDSIQIEKRNYEVYRYRYSRSVLQDYKGDLKICRLNFIIDKDTSFIKIENPNPKIQDKKNCEILNYLDTGIYNRIYYK